MKQCGHCGRENSDEAIRCQECGTVFEGMMSQTSHEASASRSRTKVFSLIVGLVILGALAATVVSISRPAVGAVLVSFSGYSTNAAGLRVANFTVVNSNNCALRYRATCVPGWTNLVRYGNLPRRSPLMTEARAPAGVRYKFMFTYCRDQGQTMDKMHRLWDRWLAPLLTSRRGPIPFAEPGFGSRTLVGPDVGQ
jgi:hypothetical protein